MAQYYDLNIQGDEVQLRLDLASHNVLAFDGILDVPVVASDALITDAGTYQIVYAPNGGRGEMLMSMGGVYYRNFKLQSDGKTVLDSSWYNTDGQIRKDRLFLNGAARDIYAYAAGAFGKVERDGVDGITPHIDPVTRHWMIGEADTGILAEGYDGTDGKSAYQIAVENGYQGTMGEWIVSLHGQDGKSAYEIWVEQPGNEGRTVSEFLASLKESGYKMQAVQTRPSTIATIDADTIYLYPDGTGQFSTAIYTGDLTDTYDSTKWVVLATNPGDLSGAFADIQDLKTQQQAVTEELAELSSNATILTDDYETDIIVSDRGVGYVNGSGTIGGTSSNYRYIEVDVSSYQGRKIHAYGVTKFGTSNKTFAFLDTNGNIVGIGESGGTTPKTEDIILTIPSDATLLRICGEYNEPYLYLLNVEQLKDTLGNVESELKAASTISVDDTEVSSTGSSVGCVNSAGSIASVQSTASYTTYTFDVSEYQNKLIKIKGVSRSGTVNHGYAFLNTDNVLLAKGRQGEATPPNPTEDINVVVPYNASVLYVTGKGNVPSIHLIEQIDRIGKIENSVSSLHDNIYDDVETEEITGTIQPNKCYVNSSGGFSSTSSNLIGASFDVSDYEGERIKIYNSTKISGSNYQYAFLKVEDGSETCLLAGSAGTNGTIVVADAFVVTIPPTATLLRVTGVSGEASPTIFRIESKSNIDVLKTDVDSIKEQLLIVRQTDLDSVKTDSNSYIDSSGNYSNNGAYTTFTYNVENINAVGIKNACGKGTTVYAYAFYSGNSVDELTIVGSPYGKGSNAGEEAVDFDNVTVPNTAQYLKVTAYKPNVPVVSKLEHMGIADFISGADFGGGGTSYWKDKKIVWYGTSIPASGYPQICCNILGAECYNEAVNASMCRIGMSSYTENDVKKYIADEDVLIGDKYGLKGKSQSNILNSLSMSQEEKKDIFYNWTTARRQNNIRKYLVDNGYTYSNGAYTKGSKTYTDEQINSVTGYGVMMSGTFDAENLTNIASDIMAISLNSLGQDVNRKTRLGFYSNSYDSSSNIESDFSDYLLDGESISSFNLITEEIDGKVDKYLTAETFPDLFVLDHGRNDAFLQNEDLQIIPNPSTDRHHYIGAMNFIINHILEYNPRARFLIVSHYNDSDYSNLIEAQNTLADYWEFPVVPLYKRTQMSRVRVIQTTAYWNNGTFVPSGGTSTQKSMKAIYLEDGTHPYSVATKSYIGKMISKWIDSNIVPF